MCFLECFCFPAPPLGSCSRPSCICVGSVLLRGVDGLMVLDLAEERVLMLLAVNGLPRHRHLRTKEALSRESWPEVVDRAFQNLLEKGLVVQGNGCFEITALVTGKELLGVR